MLRPFAYWVSESGSVLIGGEDIPKYFFHDDIIKKEKKYVIWAETFEEAMAIRNLREGFSPYTPMGTPIKCPKCDSHYYLGSGECYCGFKRQ